MSERERLHWSLEIGARGHSIDILPAAIRRSVAIEIDGHVVRRVPKPTPQRPWHETSLDVEGEVVVVALIWANLVMQTDVFVAGRSLLDARTLEAARASAPSSLTDYEVWPGLVHVGAELPAWRPLLPRWMAFTAFLAVATMGALLVVEPRPSGVVVGAVALIALGALAAIWFRSWFVVLDRAHSYLMSHPEFGDRGRRIRFWGAVLGYPLAWGVGIIALVAVFDR